MPGVFETTLTLALALAAPTGQIADAPDRLISAHGIELSNDGRVFVLFAALNGLGYSDESNRKGPPLEAPVFHPIRARARDALRKIEAQGKLKAIRKLFDDNPAEIEVYLRALLSHDLGLDSAAPGQDVDAAKLAAAMSGLRTLGGEEGLTKLFDGIALDQRRHALVLMEVLETDFDQAEKYLGTKSLRAPSNLTVIPNPLDSHDAVRDLSTANGQYLVVGPGTERAQEAVMQASLRPLVAKWAADNWESARYLKKHWDGLKISKRIAARYPDGPAYLTETLTRVLTFRSRAKAAGTQPDEEDFIDQQTKDGLRWTRAVLKALDSVEAGASIEASMPVVVARINP